MNSFFIYIKKDFHIIIPNCRLHLISHHCFQHSSIRCGPTLNGSLPSWFPTLDELMLSFQHKRFPLWLQLQMGPMTWTMQDGWFFVDHHHLFPTVDLIKRIKNEWDDLHATHFIFAWRKLENYFYTIHHPLNDLTTPWFYFSHHWSLDPFAFLESQVGNTWTVLTIWKRVEDGKLHPKPSESQNG